MTTDRIAAIREALIMGSGCSLDGLAELSKQALTHLDALEKEREWQPIATAPRDVAKILIEIDGCDHAVLSRWTGRNWGTFGEDVSWEGCSVLRWKHLPTIAGCKQQGDGDD